MRLDNFIAFLEVARYHSMKIASDHLYTTPQNVSKLVRELELRFGKKLFTRGKKQMNLTKDGEIAFKAIEEIIEKWDSLECEMKKDNIEKYTGVTKSMKIIVSYAAAESLRNIFRTMLLESNSPLIEIIETDINTIITKTPFMEDVDYIFFEQIDSDATINSR